MTPHLLRSVRARLNLLAFVLVLALPAHAPAATVYSAMYIFGDSLSETGNYAAVGAGELAYPAPYAPGRFSNGPVWVDYLAGALGFPAPTAAAAGGTNYAWGGAMTAGQTGPLPPYDLGMQTLGFLAANNGIADPAALYVVWAGGNDALAGDVTHTAGNLGAVIAALATAGARNFLVPNLPPMGEAFATVNVDLVPVLDSLQASLALQLVRLDVAGLFMAIALDTMTGGAAFGFEDLQTPCFDGTTVCADPASHVLWDAQHPTTRAHELIGQLAFAELTAVPLPAGVWLLGSALGALLVTRRRQAVKPGAAGLPCVG
jgi:phospholipase/lecithinase/hemolysin